MNHLRAARGILSDHTMGSSTYAAMKYVLSLRMAKEGGGGPMMYARTPYPQLTDAQKASLKAGLDKVIAMPA